MAARKHLHHPEEVRAKIQASQLVNALNKHALGQLKKPMDSTRVAAALGLLKKCVPDLQSIEHSGNVGAGENDKSPEQIEEQARRALGKRK